MECISGLQSHECKVKMAIAYADVWTNTISEKIRKRTH